MTEDGKPTKEELKKEIEEVKERIEIIETLDKASDELGARAKTPLGLKVVGILCFLGGLAVLPEIVLVALTFVKVFRSGAFVNEATITQIICIILVISLVLTVLAFVFFGVRLIRNKRRKARLTCEFIIVLLVVDLLCSLMMTGITYDLLLYLVAAIILIAAHTYIDPALSEERELQHKLRQMETREDAEEGTLGLDETGKGFIALDFFNLFWIFVIACICGDIIETIYHMVIVDPGVFQNRTGMVWGPFSPIYGFGAVLMTLALNRFHKANFLIIFLVSAIIGGAFEWCVSYFLQYAFGVVAWDYTGTFLSIGGRTNFMFMCMWGVLGLVWIKLLLPWMLKLVNKIPWQWRYTVTAVAATFMIVNGALTLITLDCWYSRMAGMPNDTWLMQFCADHFNNDWMANRFQSMSIDPTNAVRA